MKVIRRVFKYLLYRYRGWNKINCDFSKNIIKSNSKISYPDNLNLKGYVRIGEECWIDCEGGVTMEEGCTLSPRVTIYSSTHKYDSGGLVPFDNNDHYNPVRLGRGVWIGHGAVILPGVNVSDGAIVGAFSVVTRDVPSNVLVAGNPAQIVKKLSARPITIQTRELYQYQCIENGLKRRS